MIFIDASALIAMIVGEPDADLLADRMQQDRIRYYSAITVWETVAGLRHSYKFDVASAHDLVRDFVDHTRLKSVPIDNKERDLAIQAFGLFGKGRHTAALNMGDCFAYACAKAHRAALLFKGDDFSQTDILRAL